MNRIIKVLRLSVTAGVLLATLMTVADAQPEWQIHAKWCTTDPGSSGRVYWATCRSQNPYNAAIACQNDSRNPRAADLIRSVGPDTVNAYLAGLGAACRQCIAQGQACNSDRDHCCSSGSCVGGNTGQVCAP